MLASFPRKQKYRTFEENRNRYFVVLALEAL
jgi:hypothetical protein